MVCIGCFLECVWWQSSTLCDVVEVVDVFETDARPLQLAMLAAAKPPAMRSAVTASTGAYRRIRPLLSCLVLLFDVPRARGDPLIVASGRSRS